MPTSSRFKIGLYCFNPLTIGAGRSALEQRTNTNENAFNYVSIPSLSGQAARLEHTFNHPRDIIGMFQSPHYRGRPLGTVVWHQQYVKGVDLFQSPHYRGRPLGGRSSSISIGRPYCVSIPSLSGQAARQRRK